MIISTITLGCCLSFLAADPAPVFKPEAYLPDTMLVVFDISLSDDVLAKTRGTALWKVWEHAETQAFFRKPLEVFRKNVDAWIAMIREDPGFDLAPVKDLLPPTRIAVGIPAIDFVKGEPEAVTLFADFGGKVQDAGKALDQAIELAKKKAAERNEKVTVEEREAAGLKIKRFVRTYRKPKAADFRIDDIPREPEALKAFFEGNRLKGLETEEAHTVFEWAFKGSVLFGVAGPKPDSEAIKLERYLAPEKPLAAQEDFAAARGKVGEGAVFAFVRLDKIIEGARKAAEAEEKKPAAGSADPKEKKSLDVDALLTMLGVSSIRSIAYAQSIDGPDLVDHFFVQAPEPREGLIFSVMTAPLPAERLVRFAPKSAQMYGELSLDFQKLWEGTTKIVELVSHEEDEKSFQKDIASVEEKIGAKVPELLACFKGRLAGYSSMPATLSSMGEQGLILPLADAPKLRGILAKLRELPEVAEYLFFQDEKYEGVDMVKVTFKNLPLPLMPTYAFIEDTLVIAETPFSLQKLIASLTSGAGSLAESEKYRAVEGKLFPAGACVAEFIDMPPFVERLYELVVSVVNMALANAGAQKEFARLGIDFNLLPSAKAVAEGLGTGIEFGRLDAAGFEYWGRSSFGAGLVGLYKAAVGAIVPFAVLGGMQKAVHRHYQEASRKNMKQIHEACIAYSRTVGGGRHPNDLMALLAAGLIEEKYLAAPGDTDRKTVENPETGEKVVVSYRYRPKGFEEKGRRLVLYEAGAWLDGEERLGLFNDGSTGRIDDEKELDGLLKGKD